MYTRLVALASAALLLPFAVARPPHLTPKASPDACLEACVQDYAPVCASGKTFFNICEANCHKARFQFKGECGTEDDDLPSEGKRSGCYCIDEWAPVCSNGRTFSNSCEARCAGAGELTAGACGSGAANNGDVPADGPVDDPDHAPVDGPGGNKAGCYCTDQYSPVCSNGKTFGNACQAQCAGAGRTTKGACGRNAAAAAAGGGEGGEGAKGKRRKTHQN